jgi:leucyl aminopeptidase
VDSIKIEFGALEQPQGGGDLVVFSGDDLAVGPLTAERFGTINDLLRRAAPAERFKGKAGSLIAASRIGAISAA